jgi:hypothetical protein
LYLRLASIRRGGRDECGMNHMHVTAIVSFTNDPLSPPDDLAGERQRQPLVDL